MIPHVLKNKLVILVKERSLNYNTILVNDLKFIYKFSAAYQYCKSKLLE